MVDTVDWPVVRSVYVRMPCMEVTIQKGSALVPWLAGLMVSRPVMKDVKF